MRIAAGAPVPSTPVCLEQRRYRRRRLFARHPLLPAEKGLAYLRTDVGGAYRWDASEQRWIPLEDSIWQDSYFGIESIAPDPQDANVVYLAAGMYYRDPAAIMRSADRGADVATSSRVPFRMGGNEDGRGMGERLAVDPNRTSTLLFGSRHDGLQRSDDSGKTWHKVESFPWQRPRCAATASHARRSVVRHLRPVERNGGSGSQVIYAGIADPARNHLFRSHDGGRKLAAGRQAGRTGHAPGQGRDRLRTARSTWTTATGLGPNGADDGAVWKLDTRSGMWTDITPVRGQDAEGGYMGLSIDRRDAGRVAVSTVDRWNHHDTVWLSKDAGAHWTSLREHSTRDVSEVPFLGSEKPKCVRRLDLPASPSIQFDGGTLAYTTGGTVYRTADSLKPELLWKPWVNGVEETVPISLVSPTAERIWSPASATFTASFTSASTRRRRSGCHDPDLPHTNNLDWAGRAPNVLVRSASPAISPIRPARRSAGRRTEGTAGTN